MSYKLILGSMMIFVGIFLAIKGYVGWKKTILLFIVSIVAYLFIRVGVGLIVGGGA